MIDDEPAFIERYGVRIRLIEFNRIYDSSEWSGIDVLSKWHYATNFPNVVMDFTLQHTTPKLCYRFTVTIVRRDLENSCFYDYHIERFPQIQE
jgi:hypothetical protein